MDENKELLQRGTATVGENLLDDLLSSVDFDRKDLAAEVAAEVDGDKRLVQEATKQLAEKVTPEQRDEIAKLRSQAEKLGGAARELARVKCQPTRAAATQYMASLLRTIVEQRTGRFAAVTTKPVTYKQWALIKHLRDQLRSVGEGWANELAAERIEDVRRLASAYITKVSDALRRRFQEQTANEPESDGIVCSVCWREGCGIGPMVPRKSSRSNANSAF